MITQIKTLTTVLALLAAGALFAQPANDLCSNATVLAVNPGNSCTPVNGSTVGATYVSIPACSAGNDVWYSFTATQLNHKISVENVNGAGQYNPESFFLEIYTGDCNNLSAFYCGANFYGNKTLNIGDLTAGEVYFIRLGSSYNVPLTFKICIQTPAASPSNDDCNNAAVLPVNAASDCVTQVSGTTVNASISHLTPGAINAGYVDVWYQFTATQPNHVLQISNIMEAGANNAYAYAQIAVTAGSCGNSTGIAYSYVYFNQTIPLSFLTPGEVYTVRVYHYLDSNPFTFDLCVTTPPAPPHDNCTGALPATVEPDIYCYLGNQGSTFGATSSGGAGCGNGPEADVWYSFTATSISHLISLYTNYGVGQGFEVFSGDCNNLTSIKCSAVGYNPSEVLQNLTVGNTYYIRVLRTPEGFSDFNLCIATLPPPPANDHCAGALPVSVNAGLTCDNLVSGTTFGATNSLPGCSGQGTPHDVWFSFVASSPNQRLELQNVSTLMGYGEAPTLSLYSGDCNNPVLISCANNFYGAMTVNGLTAGSTYFVRVSSQYKSAHSFSLCIQNMPAPPANTTCASAQVLTPGPASSCTNPVSGTTAGLTEAPINSTCISGNGGSVWYSFVATSPNSLLYINDFQQLYGYSSTVAIEVFSGNDCNNLQQINCYYYFGGTQLIQTTAGEQYYIRVTSLNGSAHQFNICFGTYPAPPNDHCADATPLTVNPGTTCAAPVAGTTAGSSADNPNGSCFTGQDVWYSFVATQATHHVKLTDIIDPNIVSGLNFGVEVYAGDCNNFQQLYCWNYDHFNTNSSIAGGLVPGQTYYVRVVANQNSDPFNFNICILTPPLPPANDECTNAIPLEYSINNPCEHETAGTTLNASATPGYPYMCCGTGMDVWYSFVAEQGTEEVFVSNITNAQFNYTSQARLELYENGCNDLGNYLAYNYFYNGDVWPLTGLVPGHTYLIRVSHVYSPEAINFSICLRAVQPPANDECVNAIPLVVNNIYDCQNPVNGSTYGATQSIAACNGLGAQDLWYSFVPTTPGVRLEMTFSNAYPYYYSFSNQYEVLSGDCNNLTSIDCSNGNIGFSVNKNYTNLIPGNTYYIRFYNYPMEFGSFSICVKALPAPPVNDDCGQATILTPDPDLTCVTVVQGSTLGATSSSVDCNSLAANDVWYSFVAQNSSYLLDLTILNSYFNNYGANFGYRLLEGDCGILFNVACNMNLSYTGSYVLNNLTVGHTYYLNIYSAGSTAHDFSLCLKTLPPPPGNDLCGQATTITPEPNLLCNNPVSGTTLGATTELPYWSGDVWYQFTATSQIHVLNIANAVPVFGYGSLAFELYTGNNCGQLYQIGNGYGNSLLIPSNLIPGQTYFLRIFSYDPHTAFNFTVCVGSFPPPPVNETCAGALPLEANTGPGCAILNPGTNAGAVEWTPTGCGYGADVWYQFTATTSAYLIDIQNITPLIGYYPPTMWVEMVQSDDCQNFTSLGCYYTGQVNYFSGLTPGTTYYLRMVGDPSVPATYDICLTPVIPPANDDCANAIELTVQPDTYCSSYVQGTTAGASPSGVALCSTSNATNDTWYRFVATQTAHKLEIQNISNALPNNYSFEYALAIYSGDCNNLTPIYCLGNPYYYGGAITLGDLVPGQTYYARFITPGYGINFNICLSTPPTPPVNDACATALPVPVNSDLVCTETVVINLTNATPSPVTPEILTTLPDVWYSFTATAATHVLSMNQPNYNYFDMYLELYASTCGALGNPVFFTNISYYNHQILLQNLIPGNTYLIKVYESSYYYTSSAVDMCLSTPPVPPNDLCVNAIELPANTWPDCTTTVSGTTLGASITDPGCTANGGADVWYQFTAQQSAYRLQASFQSGVSYYPMFALYEGDCNGLTEVLSCQSILYNPGVTLTDLVVGHTYFLRFYSELGSYGVFSACLQTLPPPPPNDACIDAAVLPVNSDLTCTQSVTGTTLSASLSPTACYNPPSQSAWYTFTATASAHLLRWNMTNSYFNNAYGVNLAIYSGACGSLSAIYCFNYYNQFERILENLQPGTTYYVQVYSWPNEAHDFSLCLLTLPPAPANTACQTAITLTANSNNDCTTVISGTTAGITANSPGYCAYGHEVWYQFTAETPTQTLTVTDLVNLYGNDTPGLQIELYHGECGALSFVACGNPPMFNMRPLIPGDTYYVRVASYYGNGINFNLCLQTVPPPPNDLCSGATELIPSNTQYCNSPVLGTVHGATATNGSNCTMNADIWYSFTATATSHLLTTTNISNFYDGYYELFTGTCDNLTSLGCNYLNSNTYLNDLVPGQHYFLRIGTLYSPDGEFYLCLGTPTPDIGVYAIYTNSNGCGPTNNENLYISFVNNGSASVPAGNMTVYLQLSGANNGTYGPFPIDYQVYPYSNGSVYVTGVDLSQPGTTYMTAYAVTNGDDFHDNDTLRWEFVGMAPVTYYLDWDGDGYGSPYYYYSSCYQYYGYVTNNLDCNDYNYSINPGITEICNNIDDDCDGQIDETDLAVTATAGTIVCYGGVTTLTATGSGGSGGNYLYSVDGSAYTPNTSFTVNGGAHQVVVTDNYGCSASFTLNVPQPPAISIAPIVIHHIACGGGNNGSVDISVSSGNAPYTYLWSNNKTTQDIHALQAGTYTVTVTDAIGCTMTAAAVVNPKLALTVTKTNVTCNGAANGSATAMGNYGTPGYTYHWSTGANTATISNLSPGGYTVTLTDALGCTRTNSISIGQPTAINITGVTTNINCYGAATGAINVSVSSGTAPYYYMWNDSLSVEDRTGLSAGAYTVTVTDANGCTKTRSFAITQQSALTISFAVTPIACNGGSNGEINATASGGVKFPANAQCNGERYCYNWNTGATTKKITGLAAGSYTVTITDANGCQAVGSYVLPEPAPLAITNVQQTALPNNKYKLTVTATGGVPTYSYRRSPGSGSYQASNIFNNVPVGTYEIFVKDNNQCISSVIVVVPTTLAPPDGGTANRDDMDAGLPAAEALVTLAPNPASDQVTVSVLQPFRQGTLRVFDAQGRLVMEQPLDAGESTVQIQTGNWQSGLYWIHAVLDGETVVKKLVIAF